MKNILFILFFTSFFIFAPSAYATCNQYIVHGLKCPQATQVMCTSSAQGGSSNYLVSCCDVQTECSTAPPLNRDTATNTTDEPTDMCNFITDTSQKDKCNACFATNGSWTAIGCIKTDIAGFFSTLLTFGMSIAGGIAFLLILLGGFQILTSAGNPEQMNAGKELVGSAITGLLLIIFSVFFLKIIGIDILGIPGFK